MQAELHAPAAFKIRPDGDHLNNSGSIGPGQDLGEFLSEFGIIQVRVRIVKDRHGEQYKPQTPTSKPE